MIIDTEGVRRHVRGPRCAADALADTATGAYRIATGVVDRSRGVVSLIFVAAPAAGSRREATP